jgi:magnesium transporter
VLTLMSDFTVEKSIKLLQRLRPPQEIHQQIYITNRVNLLEGHINLQDLVLHRPEDRISSFMRENELVVRATDDQETVAKKMVHYGVMSVPVVDDNNHFLGVISSDTLVDVLVEEASEDVHKMAALPPLKEPYFEMSFFRLLYQRSYVLVALLVAESFNGTILRAYESWLTVILMSFIPMITSAGGNTGSQAAAVSIQGLASGEFDFTNMFRLMRKEIVIAGTLSGLLAVASFIRVYFLSNSTLLECFVVSSSLGVIVFMSALLGSCVPFILRRFNIDPAFSAGPFLATLMDSLGILIFCYISRLLIG